LECVLLAHAGACRRARAQHNLLIDRAPHSTLTYLASDITGRHEYAHTHGARRPNHRGEADDLPAHTLTTSPIAALPGGVGEDGGPAWHVPGDMLFDESDWDREYLRQVGGSHTITHDSRPRLTTTAYMQQCGERRPTAVHW
jgi:hypothetical protein